MRCDEARAALSARLDGEPVDDATLDRHLDSCERCVQWLAAAHTVTRRCRLLPVPDVPDLTEQIVAAVQAEQLQPVRRSTTATQVGLLVVSALQLALALPILLVGHDHEAPLHVAHEMGSFNLALALAYFITGLQPFRAGGLLPFAGIVAGLLAVTAGTDLASHRTNLAEEMPHLLAIAGFVLLWRLLDRAHPHSSRGLRQRARSAAAHVLRMSRVPQLFRRVGQLRVPSAGDAVPSANLTRHLARRVVAVLTSSVVAVPLLTGLAHAKPVATPPDPNLRVTLEQPPSQ